MSVYLATDIGKKRRINEDSAGYFYNQSGQLLLIVCDGVGGHQAGEVASQMVRNHIGERFEDSQFDSLDDLKLFLVEIVEEANLMVYQYGQDQENLFGMGTTLVLAAVMGQKVLVMNVGDSRAYLYRDHVLSQITEDHSLMNELLKTGEVTRQEAEHHPQKNYITRSIGLQSDVEIDSLIVDAELDDLYLLCSDGLSNMLSSKELAEAIESTDRSKLAAHLVDLANEAGGSDNITTVIADVFKREGE
ncbi:Stp1/IreP family PP2C-type Ser/Thr phosphatase [Atopobacter sp. AH10]|uniref:Stp1/IreP family PP2C-type Ser/Thr phosphatase n=1 Tax=Atopobacter sp. AH10 TaxID=2315861 RepID=UPI000EF21F25|nr:Stp1/IreP family PP2C-type Ser/Thr phosphatase [Atopobacter sp. AH10]RLK64043.1 Stp1/IreP family PP2C-type Ser/Thr phosphatase [Atopobacter sp. AH10]